VCVSTLSQNKVAISLQMSNCGFLGISH